MFTQICIFHAIWLYQLCNLFNVSLKPVLFSCFNVSNNPVTPRLHQLYLYLTPS